MLYHSDILFLRNCVVSRFLPAMVDVQVVVYMGFKVDIDGRPPGSAFFFEDGPEDEDDWDTMDDREAFFFSDEVRLDELDGVKEQDPPDSSTIGGTDDHSSGASSKKGTSRTAALSSKVGISTETEASDAESTSSASEAMDISRTDPEDGKADGAGGNGSASHMARPVKVGQFAPRSQDGDTSESEVSEEFDKDEKLGDVKASRRRKKKRRSGSNDAEDHDDWILPSGPAPEDASPKSLLAAPLAEVDGAESTAVSSPSSSISSASPKAPDDDFTSAREQVINLDANQPEASTSGRGSVKGGRTSSDRDSCEHLERSAVTMDPERGQGTSKRRMDAGVVTAGEPQPDASGPPDLKFAGEVVEVESVETRAEQRARKRRIKKKLEELLKNGEAWENEVIQDGLRKIHLEALLEKEAVGVDVADDGRVVTGEAEPAEAEAEGKDKTNLSLASLPVAGEAQSVQLIPKVVEQVQEIKEKVTETVTEILPVEEVLEVATQVAELPAKAVEQMSQVAVQMADSVASVSGAVADQVAEVLPDTVVEQVGHFAEVVGDTVSQISGKVGETVSDVSESVAHAVSDTVDSMTSSVSDTVDRVSESVSETVESFSETMSDTVDSISETVSDTVDSISETVSDTVDSISETVSNAKDKVSETMESMQNSIGERVSGLLVIDEFEDDSDDEFETFTNSNMPEFRGLQGMDNFDVRQENHGLLEVMYDSYIYMLKLPFHLFALGMFVTPILVSVFFTLLYLPDFQGLALDDTAQKFFDLQSNGGSASVEGTGLQMSPSMLFQVYMFSLSLSTGLQPELAPLSPYSLIVANVNALAAQLIFVFLSGAVFARLSQPSQPVRCAEALVISPPSARRRYRGAASHRVLMARYVLVGPQPLELVDVKVDLTFKYNTITRTGAYFRAHQSLKLVRPEIAYQTHGMLVRHIIDESSPLYGRSQKDLENEDAIFSVSVVGLERASMQSIFHVQHYSVVDNHVVWNAEFDDMVVVNKKKRRVVDHRLLNSFRRS
eukprot:jgi/Mesen1/5019/ME000025S04419